MYLRTPKRYRRRRRRLFSWRKFATLLAIPALAYGGWLIWEHQQALRNAVLPQIEHVARQVQTQVAPPIEPTATPNLVVVEASCENAYRAGDLEEAIKQCKVLAETKPNDVDLYYRITHLLVITSSFGRDEERMQDALQYAEKTINADPEAPHGWAIRAMVLDWHRDYGLALASALHARALDSTFAPAYTFLGEIYQDLGQYEIAKGYLEQALELDTRGIAIADTFRTQGLWYSNQGRWDEAIQPYQAALQNAPTYTYIAIELANNYIALGQVNKAIEVLSQAWDRNPTDPMVLFTLANAHQRNGNIERAYEFYQRCLDVDPDNVPCLSYLGGLQWSDGDFVTAIANLERAIDLGSDDPDDYYQLGHSQAALGRCDLALPYLRRGYQMVQENGDERRQQLFTNALRSCGASVGPPQLTPTP